MLLVGVDPKIIGTLEVKKTPKDQLLSDVIRLNELGLVELWLKELQKLAPLIGMIHETGRPLGSSMAGGSTPPPEAADGRSWLCERMRKFLNSGNGQPLCKHLATSLQVEFEFTDKLSSLYPDQTRLLDDLAVTTLENVVPERLTEQVLPSKPVVDALCKTSVEIAIRDLLVFARRGAAQRSAAQKFGTYLVPALIDWSQVRYAQSDDEPHLTIPSIVGALSEATAARAEGRAFDHSCERKQPGRVSAPSAQIVPLQSRPEACAQTIAEIILRQDGWAEEDLADELYQLYFDANEIILYNRADLGEDTCYQMYLVFKNASAEIIKKIRERLPALWLIQGKSGGAVRLTKSLRELYQWKK